MLSRRRPPLRAPQTLGLTLAPGAFFQDVWGAVQGQAEQEASTYKAELLQLAKDGAKDKLGADAGAIVSPLLDAVSDGQVTPKELVKVLSNAATVGVTAGCAAITGLALTPVCAVAGGIVGKLVGNLLSSSSGTRQASTPYYHLQLARLRAEKKEVYASLLGQVRDEQLRERVYQLVEAFYDERVLFASNINEGALKRAVYLGDEYEEQSYFWDSEFGGGYFAPFANFFQVLPWELGKLTPKEDFGVPLPNLPIGQKEATPRDLLKKCRFGDDQACRALDAPFYLQNGGSIARRREWFDALWSFLVNRGFKLKASDRKTWFTDTILADPEWLQMNLQMVVYPYIKAKFESIAGAIIAADIAIRQKPVLDALDRVTEDLIQKYGVSCTSSSCKEIVRTQAKKISKELVLYAAKGPNPVQMEEAIRDAEDQISSFLKIGSVVETVEETKAAEKKAESRKNWLSLLALAAAAAAAVKYRRKLGFR